MTVIRSAYAKTKGVITMIEKVVKEIDNARVMIRDAEIVKKYRGTLSSAVRFIERNQICEVGLWKKFVDVFRIQKDATYPAPMTPWSSWRSEYWGKMMRGACMVLA